MSKVHKKGNFKVRGQSFVIGLGVPVSDPLCLGPQWRQGYCSYKTSRTWKEVTCKNYLKKGGRL